MALSLIQDECSICESQFQSGEETITTECNHTFHRICAQKRLKEKNKTDCRTCGRQFALMKAFEESQLKSQILQDDSEDNEFTQIVRNYF